MIGILTIYLILNCLFLSYVRLRDINKLGNLNIITKIVFISYIGLLALPLHGIYWLKTKLLNNPTSKA